MPEIITDITETSKYVAFDEIKPWGFGESAWKKFQVLKQKVRKSPLFPAGLHREKLFSKTYWREFLNEDETAFGNSAEILIKSDQSTSGRGHLRVPRLLLGDAAFQKKLEQRRGKGDTYLIEPFYDKVKDFSVQYEIFSDGRVKEFEPRFFVVDQNFQYKGSVFGRNLKLTEFEECSRVLDREKMAIKEAHARVIERLKVLHYIGPVGIDAFVYRNSDDELKVRPVVEVNARYTMGRVAQEMERALLRTRASGEGFLRFMNQSELVAFGCRNFKDLETKLKLELGTKVMATTPSDAVQTWTFMVTDYQLLDRLLLG